jgi:hypothetical protein
MSYKPMLIFGLIITTKNDPIQANTAWEELPGKHGMIHFI